MTAIFNQSAVELRLDHSAEAARLMAEYMALFHEVEPIWPDPNHTTGWYSLDAWRGWSSYSRGLVAVSEGAYDVASAHLRTAYTYLRAADMVWGAGGAELVLGQIARAQGNYRAARTHFESGYAAFEAIGDRWQRAAALDHLGRLAFLLGDWQASADTCQRALKLREVLADPVGLASSWRHLGEVAQAQGKYNQASQCYEHSLQLCREVGHQLGESSTLAHLGQLALHQGESKVAKRLLEESLAIRRQAHRRLGIGHSAMLLAQALHELGEPNQAQVLIRESLDLGEGLGSHWLLAYSHTLAGRMAWVERQWTGAAERFRKALAQASQLQAPPAILHVFVALVPLLIGTGRATLADQTLTTVTAHPAADFATRMKAEQERATWARPSAKWEHDVPEPVDLDELVHNVEISLQAQLTIRSFPAQ